jgi:peptidoglycan hydrolase-like protein with peptidoglycan-binding domain
MSRAAYICPSRGQDRSKRPKTQTAITEYQRKNGLREAGRFDQATLGQLGVGPERADTTGSPSRRN